MAELRRRTPASIALFTAGALEQGRNGWTHERPEVEAYFAAMMRNGNVFPLFPVDANMVQVAYEWALSQVNVGIPIFASKSPLPIRSTIAQAGRAVEAGAFVVDGADGRADVVFAVVGDMALLPATAAAAVLRGSGPTVRVVSVVNPARLFRPCDTLASMAPIVQTRFMTDEEFDALFGAKTLIAVSGGASGMLEPVLLRSRAAERHVACWKRGDTVANPQMLFELNGIDSDSLVAIATRSRAEKQGGGTR
ncbi:MAG: hypothetical protein EA382_11210 [Spirochaetaceae bacterium]|nr:MAG: hypothetical protein EA382_11210 [Spirochaetaceae bacterium]